MIQRDIWLALRSVIQSFDRQNVTYYIGGSVASSIYGVARSTVDADVVAELQNQHIDGFVQDLGTDYYASRSMIVDAIRNGSSFNVIHHDTTLKVDVFAVKTRDYDQTACQRIRQHTVKTDDGPLEVSLAAPEDVILNKLEWYEKGDRISERQFLDVVGMLDIQRNSLDLNYLRQWATHLNLRELLTQAIDAAEISET